MAMAIGVLFIVGVWTPLGLPIGGTLALLAFAGWAWPSSKDAETENDERISLEGA
jgi:hypothetical protein